MKRAFTLLEVVIITGIIVLAAVFLVPIFNRTRGVEHKVSCMSNLKQLGLGVLQYVQDYDRRFPLGHSTETTGWGDGIYPYVKSYSIFQCPNAAQPMVVDTPSPSSGGVTLTSDYFYNRRLEDVAQSKVPFGQYTILLGDGLDNAPRWSSQIELPPDAGTNSASPALRHDEGKGAYYGFADGHVKRFSPDQILNFWPRPENGLPRFAVSSKP